MNTLARTTGCVMIDKLKELLNKLPFKVSPYLVLVVVLIIVIVFSLTGRRSQNDAFDAFVEAYVAGDADGIVELMPREYISSLIDNGEIDSKEDLVAGIHQMLAYLLQDYDSDELKTYDYKIAYKVETEKGDSSADIYFLRSLFGDRANKVKEICIIHYDPTIRTEHVDGGSYIKSLSRCDVSLVKIGQSWYVTDFTNLSNWI